MLLIFSGWFISRVWKSFVLTSSLHPRFADVPALVMILPGSLRVWEPSFSLEAHRMQAGNTQPVRASFTSWDFGVTPPFSTHLAFIFSQDNSSSTILWMLSFYSSTGVAGIKMGASAGLYQVWEASYSSSLPLGNPGAWACLRCLRLGTWLDIL